MQLIEVLQSVEDDELYRSILLLRLCLTLAVNLPSVAMQSLTDLEKLDGVKATTVLLKRAHVLVLLKQHKVFKRDLKPSSEFTTKESVAFEFLRANMEFVRVSLAN